MLREKSSDNRCQMLKSERPPNACRLGLALQDEWLVPDQTRTASTSTLLSKKPTATKKRYPERGMSSMYVRHSKACVLSNSTMPSSNVIRNERGLYLIHRSRHENFATQHFGGTAASEEAIYSLCRTICCLLCY